MSGSGFRGRGIEPWGICPNGRYPGTFHGARLSQPCFNYPHLPHGRLPGSENWSGRANHNGSSLSWTNAKYQRPLFRGMSHFRPNGRGRGTIHRGAVHFHNSNRPPIRPYNADHNKNVERPRTVFIQQDQHNEDQLKHTKNEPSLQHTPLLGSEEERQRKITETAFRLKEKLSNITKEDITNLWQDDLSTVPSSSVEDNSTLYVGITNLEHEQSELNLTFNDFKDIGRIDSDNLKSNKNGDIIVIENPSNFIQDTVKEIENSVVSETINIIDREQNSHDVESMTTVNDMTENMLQNDNGQKLQEGTNSLHSIPFTSSPISKTCDTELVSSLQQTATKADFKSRQDKGTPAIENTQSEDDRLNIKCVSTSLHQLEYKKPDDKFNLTNTQKSCDDTQHEQVDTFIKRQHSLHRSVSKLTKERSHWVSTPYETNSLHRKPFKSRWLHRKHNYIHNRLNNELSHQHRNVSSSCQDSQYNVSFDLNGRLPSEKSSAVSDNSQSMLCLDRNISPSISTNVSSSRELVLQTVPVFDPWKPSSIGIGCTENTLNIPNFNPQQPPPNFNNQKSMVPLSSVFEPHILPQEQSNVNIHASDSSQPGLVSTTIPGTTAFCTLLSNVNVHAPDSSQPGLVSTTIPCTTAFSTLSQLDITKSPNVMLNVPNNFSPILTYSTSLQVTPYEVPSPSTISNTEHQTLLCNKILDHIQVPNQHSIFKVKDELEEKQEAMQFAKQAMEISYGDNVNNVTESDQIICSRVQQVLEQESTSDASPSPQVHQTINKEKEKLNPYCSKVNNKKGQALIESHASPKFEREKRLNRNSNVGEDVSVSEQKRTKVMFDVNPKLSKKTKQEKWQQPNESGEKEKYISCVPISSMYPKECSDGTDQDTIWKHNVEAPEIDTINSPTDETQTSCPKSPVLFEATDIFLLQKSEDAIKRKKKTESPVAESSWKDRIISRFLKMSKNDIRNMINNSSLRKFDIAMKHLVKEKRSSLSLEMRNTEDEKIKSYDREEFMNQLNAMLDPTAVVNITNLPTDFIHHLSEVLQLDAIPLESSESIFSEPGNENKHSNLDVFDILCTNEQEMLNDGEIPIDINFEKINDRASAENGNQMEDQNNEIVPFVTEELSINDISKVPTVSSDEMEENRTLDSNQIFKSRSETDDVNTDNVTNDIHAEYTCTQKNIKKEKQHSLFDMTELDDIFSTVAIRAAGESKSIISDNEPKSTGQANEACEIINTSIPIDIETTISVLSKTKISDSTKEHKYSSGNEYISKSERYNRWTRREREAPDAFRNLTKEEWEAKYGRQTKSSISNSYEVQSNKYYNNKYANTKYSKSVASGRHHSPHSFNWNRNYQTASSKRTSREDKNTESASSTSDSSENETDDSSTSSDDRPPSEVTKLLKVIKEKEKIAKNKSLNETIRDEVSAEIQRKWSIEDRKRKHHKKDKRKKEEKWKYKKEREKKKRKIFEDEVDKSSLLADIEIKKETISKEESEIVLRRSTRWDKVENNVCSKKQVPTNVSTDEKASLETKDKCIIQESDRATLNPTTIQPKTKAQLKLIPETSKGIEETEFMKNTAKIVLNAKCKENKVTGLNHSDKQKIIEKTHQKDKSTTGANEPVECSDSRSVSTVQTEHVVSNNNDSTSKNLTNTSIIKEQRGKERTCDLTKEVLLITTGVKESNTERLMDSKVASKKLDIKAYKARALQRKIESDERTKEDKSVISNKHVTSNETSSNITSKTTTEEEEKSDADLKEKHSSKHASKLSVDSSKFKNIKSECSKELKLKKEKIKKKTDVETKVKEAKEISSVNQEKVNDRLEQTPIHTISIKNKEVSANDTTPSKSASKETENEKDKGIFNNENNTGLATAIMDKENSTEITSTVTQVPEVLNDIQINKNKDKGEKSDKNEAQRRTRTISTCSELLAEVEMCVSLQKHSNKKQLPENIQSDSLPLCNTECLNQSSTYVTDINVDPPNQQNKNLKENIRTTSEADLKLLEKLDNFEIQKINSPESVGSPFKGFIADLVESSSCPNLEMDYTITTVKDNITDDTNKQLQSCSNDKSNWQNLSIQDTLIENDIISTEQTNKDEDKLVYEKSLGVSEGTMANLKNNINLVNNDKDRQKETVAQTFAHECTDNIQVDENNRNTIKQSKCSIDDDRSIQPRHVETSIPYTSSVQHKMFVELNECEDNAVMEKSDIDIVKDSSFIEKQSCQKDIIESICASTGINLSDINNTIASSFNEISNEICQNIINTDTESSSSSLAEANAIANYNAFKDTSNQDIVSSTMNSCEEGSTNNNDSRTNNDACDNFNFNLPVSTERFWKSSTKEAPKKLRIPTKAALKESRNTFAIVDGSLSSAKDQKVVDFLTDQISQKENIDNKIINLEQRKYSQDPHKSVDTDSLSKTISNKARILDDEILISSNRTSYIKELEANNVLHNPVVELENIKETNKWITNTIQNTIGKNIIDEDLNKSSMRTNKQEKTNNLHGIRMKSATKHKMKNRCKSNAVHVTNTNIKEEIMARMIEIDMEIHKLMTEKMTLYQMLESDSLLSNKLPLNSNLGSEINKKKMIPVRSETSSALTPRTIQNTEASFIEHSDYMITSNRENVLPEISENQTEPKVVNTNKDEASLREEDTNRKEDILSHSPEHGMASDSNDNSESLLSFKDGNKIQEHEVLLPEDEFKENLDTSSSTEETLNNATESSLESMPTFEKEEQLCVSSSTDIIKPFNEQPKATSTLGEDKKQNVQSVKASLIYSDDSTWGSFVPSLEEEQKKHNTGLALLEETYKREIAETRKLKASARKKKKKELDKFLKTVNYLTPEEEDIPLNTLYIKKLQQKRDLLYSLDDKKESSIIDDCISPGESENIWKHAMEVINAVAEDRINDLYVGKIKENENEILTASSNTTKQNANISEVLENLNESLPSLNETQATLSLPNRDQKQNSIKCSLNIIDNDIFQLKREEKKGDTESKKSNAQTAVISCNNLKVNASIVNALTDDKLIQEKVSSVEQPSNSDYIANMSAFTEVHESNISNPEINKNQNDHTLQASAMFENTNTCTQSMDKIFKEYNKKEGSSNHDTAVSVLPSDKLKYNNKTEENKESTCLLKNKGSDISKSGYETDETTSNIIEGTSNIRKKKFKVHVPTTSNSTEVTDTFDSVRSGNVQDRKTSRRKRSSKSMPVRRCSKYSDDSTRHIESDDNNSNGGKDSPKVSLHSFKGISSGHHEFENTSSNVKHRFQKLQNSKDKRCINYTEDEESSNDHQSFVSNENSMTGRVLSNTDSQVSTFKVQGAVAKRKLQNQPEIMDCKVRLVDVLKSSKYQHAVEKLHTSSVKIHVPYKPTTTEVTTNSTHFVASSKTCSSIADTSKLKDVKRPKHITFENLQEHDKSQKHVTKIHGCLEIPKEIKSHHKVNALPSDEHLSLETNSKDTQLISVKPITSILKTLPQQDRKPEIEIVEEKTKDQYNVNQPQDEEISSDAVITENEQPSRTQYTTHKGPILDIKVFGDTFLAASEDGSIYRYSQTSNGILNIYKGHRSAVTCLYIHKSSGTDYPKDLVYSGSLDGTLRCYNIKTGTPSNNIANVGSPVQCMDQAWGIIFIGTKSGHVSRFHIKFGVIKGDSIQFSDKSVLALKATNEGPRRVLIVASRNQPITIRDAQNGLFLRTICGQKNHTVYSLMRNNNLIYCGTSSTSILVFDFTNGEQTAQYDAGVGIVCMRLYHKLLFAGCYDGNIYVFDIQDHRLIHSIPGPGNMLLSMEVVDNKIIAGSKDKRLHTWQMPKQVQVVSRET